MNKITLITVVLVVSLIMMVFIKENKNEVSYTTLQRDSVILAVGDSLTYGFGVSGEFSYPAVMQKRTGYKVINAGVNGETSEEGLARLPKNLEQKPDLVILCYGGNDILLNLSKEKLKQNLLQMIKLIKSNGADIILVGVPNFNMVGFDLLSLYSEVADDSGVILENDILRYIELHRNLKSDYVHPNKDGYEMMADTFIKLLKDKKFIP